MNAARHDTHRPRKRFGQNFLESSSVLDQILRSIAPDPTDQFVEIGPGLGALTRPILTITQRLDVVELDRDLLPKLAVSCKDLGELITHQADALTFDFGSLVTPGNKFRVVGNLPYNISTPLLFHLFQFKSHIIDMHFMLQKEVVDRIVAAPGSSNYGRLSVMVQYHCQAQRLFPVPATAFRPQPKVESAFLRLVPHPIPLFPCADEVLLEAIVKLAFSQRRKTIRNTLKTVMGEEALKKLGIDPGLRAQALTVAEFVSIVNVLSPPSLK